MSIVSNHLDRAQAATPAWLARYVNWSAYWSVSGSPLLPRFVRRVPLRCACLMVAMVVYATRP